MDDLLDSLSSDLRVSTDANSTAAQHPRFASYKVKYSASSQSERRREFIEKQKQRRFDFQQHARNLADGFGSSTGSSTKRDPEEKMDCSIQKPRRNTDRLYRNQLMLSEWLVEYPEQFEEDWVMKLCPVGKRCLVISSRGSTKAYARNGYHMATFSSLLPGGSKGVEGKFSDYCLLDCIYSELHKVYHVLDLMCWKSHPIFDSEADFRFYWLDAKLEEIPEVKEASEENRYRFLPLPRYPCSAQGLTAAMNSPLPFEAELDGLLFFHKRAHYHQGVTPLVGWLKAYMVPEILHLDVHPGYLEQRPAKHETGLKDKLEANKSRTRGRVEARQEARTPRRKSGSEMDV
ncbi:unnamed protein product [Ixodes persulcatus]